MNPSIARRLWQLIAPYRGRMAVAVFLGFATVGSNIGLMMTGAFIIAMAALHPSIAALQVAIVGVRFFGLSRGIFRYGERLISHDVNLRLLADIRVWFYERLEILAPARLQRYRSGDLLSRMVADVAALENFFVRVLAPSLVAIAILLLMLGLLAAYHWLLAVIFALLYMAAGIGVPWVWQRLGRKAGRQLSEHQAALSAALVNMLQGLADILIFEQADIRHQHLQALEAAWYRQQRRMKWLEAAQNAAMTLVVSLTVAATLAVAVPLVRANTLNGVDMAVIVLGVMAAFEAVMPLPLSWQFWQHTQAAASRLFEIIDAPPAVTDPPDPLPLPGSAPHLQFIHLSFSYEESRPLALHDFNLTLSPGKRVAVIGASGAGKSTLVNLLLRFWPHTPGQILLNSRPLAAYAAHDLRRLFAVVSQDTFLFNVSLRENLLLARPDADDRTLRRALKQAHLLDFVESLPAGWHTVVGEQGLQLSGGERQRLAIARALLQDAPIMLLDEPFAHLDNLTAAAIWRHLQAALSGRSVLLLSHQLLGLPEMDEIVILQAGRVVARGNHDQLWQQNATYRQMWELTAMLG